MKAGYEGQLFVGNAGSQAALQVLNCEDLNYDNDNDKISTTTRGDGLSVPKKSEKVVAIGATVTFSMLEKPTDTILTTLRAAARSGAPVAVRTKSYATGTGFDGDMNLTVTHEMTLAGQSKYNFTGTPNDELRAWQPDV